MTMDPRQSLTVMLTIGRYESLGCIAASEPRLCQAQCVLVQLCDLFDDHEHCVTVSKKRACGITSRTSVSAPPPSSSYQPFVCLDKRLYLFMGFEDMVTR